jgi:hypothetical protein
VITLAAIAFGTVILLLSLIADRLGHTNKLLRELLKKDGDS